MLWEEIKMKINHLVISIFWVLLLAGCSSDGNSGGNVALSSITSPTNGTYLSGQTFSVEFTTETSSLETRHVGVTFIVIERDKVGQLVTSEDPEGDYVGDHYIDQLQEGEQLHTAELMLPNVDMTAGEYVIAAYVDSSGVIEDERTTIDNKSRGIDDGDETTYGSLTIGSGTFHDFVIDEVTVGDGYAIFPGPDHADDTSGTGEPDKMHSDLIGYIDASKYGDNVNTARVTAHITIAEVDYTAHLWDPETNTYTDDMLITFADHKQSHYFPWDIAINGSLLNVIHEAYDPDAEENTFSLTFTLHDEFSDDIEHSNVNNEMTIEVPFALYSNTNPIDTTPSLSTKTKMTNNSVADIRSLISFDPLAVYIPAAWSHTYGDKGKVAIQSGFGSSVRLSSNYGAATLQAYGTFDLYMFDSSITVAKAVAGADVSAADGTAGWYYDLTILELPIWREGETISALDESFPYSWEEEVLIFKATITVAIVPVTVEAGITGAIGPTFNLTYADSTFTIGGDITAGLGAYATAAIDLGVASGGIGVDFKIVENTFSANAYADLTNVISDSEFTYGLEVTNELKAIEGEFYLFVNYTGYKFCCSFPEKSATYTIYDTGALYDKTWTLLDESETITVPSFP